MFIDERYACCTINLTRHEIFRTTKFKTKYPWRDQFRDKIRGLPNDSLENDNVLQYIEVIKSLIDHGIINKKTSRDFDLSHVDIVLISCTLGNGYKISTGDDDIKNFAMQEFRKEFKGWISPLGMLNAWTRKGIIDWNDKYHEYLTDWNRNKEDPQPKHQQRKFKKLTGLDYPGS